MGAWREDRLELAAGELQSLVEKGLIAAAVLYVVQRHRVFARALGAARSEQAMFLLGSISKPICMTALMTLFDRGAFQLDDRLRKFIPEFTGDGRDEVTIRHLLTHVSGLPDHVADNLQLREQNAPLAEFVDRAIRTPLGFRPDSRYEYSSMAILLAARVAELISGQEIRKLVEQTVFAPLKMERSAQGLGQFQLGDLVSLQTDRAAPEAGGGDPRAKDWDWNSHYWRSLGAPWGGTHASAVDIATWITEFLDQRGDVLSPDTARLMTANANRADVRPWGLGWGVGTTAGGRGCSGQTFGHSGSTGTLAWADPATRTICVVLTSLPAAAAKPHPRDVAADLVASAVT